MIDLSRYREDVAGLPQPLLERHVPLIHQECPRWNYITAVCVTPPGSGMDRYQMPEPWELEMVASYHDQYVEYFYGDPSYGWIARQRAEHPFDIDGGANGRFLMKYESGGWGLSRRSWRVGPRPSWNEPPLTLIEVLDKERDLMPEQWSQWKDSHADSFGDRR